MEILRESFRSLLQNKLRTFLSMLGIVIGVIAVITAISLGAGTTKSVTERISSLGSNVIMVMPGFSGGFGGRRAASLSGILNTSDVQNIETMAPAVGSVTPVLQKSTIIRYGSSNANATVFSADPDVFSILGLQLDSGSTITAQDEQGYKNVAIIGSTVSSDLFSGADPIGKQIYITVGNSKIPFTIIGLLQQTGSKLMYNPDEMVMIPYTTGEARVFQMNGSVSSILASAKSAKTAQDAVSEIEQILYMRLQDTTKYRVISQDAILSTVSETTGILTLMLASLAAMSLLVGGIGIMNIMLVSVTERTREIGIKLAIGATRKRILFEFLVESMVITFVAGLIGVLGSVLIANLVDFLGKQYNLEVVVSLSSVFLSVGVSVFIGLFFGIYPANMASKKSPIEALKYQ